MASALVGRVGRKHISRTCLFANSEKANGAAYTGVLTGTIGYRRGRGNRPYGRYRVYGKLSSNAVCSIIRVSTTSGGNISGVESLHRRTGCAPSENGCHIFVVSRIRVLSANTFGTLLGALRRPPRRIVFVLTAARIRGLPTAVLSHYREFSFGQVRPRAVTVHLGRITNFRGVELSSRATILVTEVTSNNVHSTLSVLSRYTNEDGSVSRGLISRITNVTNERTLCRLSRTITTGGDNTTLSVVTGLRTGDCSVRHLYIRVVGRCHGFLVIGAIGGGEKLVVYASSRCGSVMANTRSCALPRIVGTLSLFRSALIGVGNNTGSEVRVRVDFVGLYRPGLSSSIRSVLSELSRIRGTIHHKVATIPTSSNTRTNISRTGPRPTTRGRGRPRGSTPGRRGPTSSLP